MSTLSEQPTSNGLGEATPDASASTGPETSGLQPSKRQSPSEQLASIGDLLRGSDDGDAPADPESSEGSEAGAADDAGQPDSAPAEDEAGSGGDEGAAETSGPLTVKELAAKLDIEPSELYNQVKVPISDDEALTITQLQDSYRDRAASEQAIASKADEINSREAGLVTDIQALGVLQAMQQLPQPVLQQANSHLVEMAQREYQNFLTLHPDLQEDGNRLAFEKGIGDWLGAYGISVGHIPVRTVGMYRLMRDVLRDRAELKKLKTPQPAKAPQSVKSQRAPAKKAAPIQRGARGRTAELSQINALMGRK